MIYVKCPKCAKQVMVELDDGIYEGSTVEGYAGHCQECDMDFSFDIYPDVLNKRIINGNEE